MKTLITMDIVFDPDAKVYIATSKDIPGLVVEAETVEGVLKEADCCIPELLKLNKHLLKKPRKIPGKFSLGYLVNDNAERVTA